MTGYHLQMDASDTVFVDIFGADEMVDVLSTNAIVTEPLIQSGVTYGFRYRARNIYGWGNWSPITYILPASVPSAPAAPAFISATANSIKISLALTEHSNGDHFESHELFMAQGDSNIENSFSQVTSYLPTSQSLEHEVTFATDGIMTG